MSEFKVGDKVRVTELLIMDDEVGLAVGDVGVVTRWQEGEADGWAQFHDEVHAGEPWLVQAQQLELVTDELPARFKFKTKYSASDAYTASVDAERVLVSWDHAGGGKIHYPEWEVRKLLRDGDWTIIELTVEPTTAEALQAATDALAAAERESHDAATVRDELYESYGKAQERARVAYNAQQEAVTAFRQALAKHYGIS